MLLRPVSAAFAALVLSCGSLHAEADHHRISTTRIETRPAYGAIATMEGGVRVIRALPPTHHVIVNPHGRTPLHLSFEDVRVTEHRAPQPSLILREVVPAGGSGDFGVVVQGDGRHGRRHPLPHRHHP